MAMIVDYVSKKALKAAVGQPLRYVEAPISGRTWIRGYRAGYDLDLGSEYRSDGTLTVQLVEHFAKVTMEDGIIVKVT